MERLVFCSTLAALKDILATRLADNDHQGLPGCIEAEEPQAGKVVQRVSCHGCDRLSLFMRLLWCVLCRARAEEAQNRLAFQSKSGSEALADAQVSVVSKAVADVHEDERHLWNQEHLPPRAFR